MAEPEKKYVLVVEDSETEAFLLRKYIEKYDGICDTVTSGEAALKEIVKKNYDYVFVDIRLPKMTGVDLINLLVSEHMGFNAKVIICTSEPRYLYGFPVGKFVGLVIKPLSEQSVKNALTWT